MVKLIFCFSKKIKQDQEMLTSVKATEAFAELEEEIKKLRKQINLFVFICIGSLVLSNTFADDEFWLLTESEYALLDVENSIDEKLNYSLNTGPKINLVSPSIVEKVDAPVNIFNKI